MSNPLKNNPLKIGFLGTGGIAASHARALAKLPDVRITALCNHHLDKAEAFNREHAHGAAHCYDDFQRMLAQEKIDALYVCLPPGAHTGQTEAAARRGIHLLLEKPIALTNERAASIAAAVREAGVQCQIGHHMRHTAPVQKLRQMLDDGTAGRPLFMQGRFLVNGLFPAWWRDPQMGGGQLVEQSIHLYDLARYFLGRPATITAFVDNLNHQRFPDYRVDDVSAATIRFANGAIASLCAANCAEPLGGSIRFTVLCEKVMVEFAHPDEATFIHHGGRVSEEFRAANEKPDRETVRSERPAGEAVSANFIGALRGTATPRSSIEDGVEGLRLVLAAQASSLAGGMPQSL